jgi:hypothetical protein
MISLLQFNHDYTPPPGTVEAWGLCLQRFMTHLDPDDLPSGVGLVETRHSDDMSQMERTKLQLREAKDLLTDARAMLAENWKKLPTDATGLRQGIERLLVEIERTKTCAWPWERSKL